MRLFAMAGASQYAPAIAPASHRSADAYALAGGASEAPPGRIENDVHPPNTGVRRNKIRGRSRNSPGGKRNPQDGPCCHPRRRSARPGVLANAA